MQDMRVFRGRLVHCKKPGKIEILEDHLIGFEGEYGKVVESVFVSMHACHGVILYLTFLTFST